MDFEVSPLESQDEIQPGEEAEVYGYDDCWYDCLRWRGKNSPTVAGCVIEVSCYWSCSL